MSRLPHFIDMQLTDGDEVSFTCWPLFNPNEIGTHFCERLGWLQGHNEVERILQIEKKKESNHLIRFESESFVLVTLCSNQLQYHMHVISVITMLVPESLRQLLNLPTLHYVSQNGNTNFWNYLNILIQCQNSAANGFGIWYAPKSAATLVLSQWKVTVLLEED
jgi:hypothetical protein